MSNFLSRKLYGFDSCKSHNIEFYKISNPSRDVGDQGCARFAEILPNFSEGQIVLSLFSVVFHALTLQLPIQPSLSVVPELPVSLSSAETCHKFRKTSTLQMQQVNSRSPPVIFILHLTCFCSNCERALVYP